MIVELRTRRITIKGVTTTTIERIPHHEKRIIFRRRFGLVNFKATLNPGVYVYPFRFRLDEQIPGSFYMSNGDAMGRIMYKLKAEVTRPGMFKANVKHTQMVQISNRLLQPITKIQMIRESNVTRCSCIDMGEISCAAILDKNAYTPGEVANLIISIDNTASDVTLKHVSFKLANHGSMRARYYTQTFWNSECKNQAPSIPKGDTAHINFSLNIPNDLTPTTHGILINSYYEMEVVLSVPCSTDLMISLPVTIFAVPPQDYITQVQYPPERPPQYQNAIEINESMFNIY